MCISTGKTRITERQLLDVLYTVEMKQKWTGLIVGLGYRELITRLNHK